MTAARGSAGAISGPPQLIYHRELTLSATYSSSPVELAEAFELLVTGRVRVDGLISHRLPLGRLGEGVELMRRHEAVKVYVTP
jgi:L-iditol 2-dehydrogenase